MKVTADGPIRIAIIDDETLFSGAIAWWLRESPGLCVVGCAAGGRLGWELCQATRPDVALVDCGMDDGDGLTLAKRLRAELPEVKLIIMTGQVNPFTAWQAGEIGVSGLIDKAIQLEGLSTVIRLVADGGEFVSPSFQGIRDDWLTKPESFQNVLTPRELAVLSGVAACHSDDTIGNQLGISPETVAWHRKTVRKKLGAHNDRSLVAQGQAWGFSAGGRSETESPARPGPGSPVAGATETPPPPLPPESPTRLPEPIRWQKEGR